VSAPTSERQPQERSTPSSQAGRSVPSLMETLAVAERNIAEALGDTGPSPRLGAEEAQKRLAVLLWTQALAQALEDQRRRSELDREWRRSVQKRAAATGWLRFGNRAWRSLLVGAVCAVAVATFWASGSLV
jgi:hypothetical protein